MKDRKQMGLKEQIYSVLVVSASENFNKALSSLLPVQHYEPVCYAANIGSARRILNEREFDFVIINSPLPDDIGTGLAVDVSISNGSVVLLIIRDDLIEDVQMKIAGDGVFTLAKPLSTQTFSMALGWMASTRERLRSMERKTISIEEKMKEIRYVNKAKWLLITEQKMDEPQAHRYIEKQAMDRCITRLKVAEEIIRTYS